MNASHKLKGTGIALVTPFTKKGKVDFYALSKLTEHLIRGKVDYLVALGTTGESVTLSKEEKKSVLECIIETTARRLPVVLGLGGNNTAELIDALSYFKLDDVTALLSVSPYYNRPTQQGIFEHYAQLAKHSAKPIILYNVPSRSGSNISASTTLKLASAFKNIIGVKEASGNMHQIMHIIGNKPADFMVISGDDALTLPILACGGVGVISVVGNAYPKEFSEMVRLALKGNYDQARKLHQKFLPLIDLVFEDGSPAGVKEFLSELGICDRFVRLPLVNVNKDVKKRIAGAAWCFK